ncbi:MAG: LysR family transcriptional regulator [Burkholderiales bacterium]|nr:LysR family transcriptional regulator [Burkholderiales bacterium]GIK85233.1 MAG: transcriptional regulator [Betaproteobacteria bacterium]
MDWLQPMRIFVSVVQNGSLSSAGRELGLSPASVSRHISALESGLGCRLLNRSSRKLTLTEAGAVYFGKVEQILQQVAEANDSVAQLQTAPRGTLRVHSRMLVGHLVVVPALPRFLAQYPDLKVDLLLSNHAVDLVERNVDVDIRIGKLNDTSLVARRLAPAERVLCAAPAYLAARPAVAQPADLASHSCLTYRINVGQTVWRFIGGDGAMQEVPVGGCLQSDNGLALLSATLAGLGVSLMPDWAVREPLRDGRLQRLLPQYRISHIEFDNGVYAVYQRTLMSAKVRAFIDFLATTFEDAAA